MKYGKIQRIAPELFDIIKSRSMIFRTSVPKETKNLATLINDVEMSLGVDFKNAVVTTKGVKQTDEWKIKKRVFR